MPPRADTGELKLVESDDEWTAYHSIRERVLWDARGDGGRYRTLGFKQRAGEHSGTSVPMERPL